MNIASAATAARLRGAPIFCSARTTGDSAKLSRIASASGTSTSRAKYRITPSASVSRMPNVASCSWAEASSPGRALMAPPPRRRRALRRRLVDLKQQLAEIDGLAVDFATAAVQRLVARLVGIGGDEADDRDGAGEIVVLQRPRHAPFFAAAKLRLEQDHVWLRRPRARQRGVAVGRQQHLMAAPLDPLDQHLAELLVVLDNQNFRHAAPRDERLR